MFKLKVLIILSVASLAFCGVIPSEIEQRIVGGYDAEVGQFPYQVSLRNQGLLHFCGGAIIGVNWVITAAHCTNGQIPLNILVVTGSTKLSDSCYVYKSQQIIIHEKYDPNANINDISLIKVAGQIYLNSQVQIISLGHFITQGGEGATISGWGQTTGNPGNLAQNLKYLSVTTMALNRCAVTKIYTTPPSKEGLCYGDQGGPLVSSYGLIGITSVIEQCGYGTQSFTRISFYSNWIANNTGIY